jgi:glycosyltransferase involved in cell wall biosynthesis
MKKLSVCMIVKNEEDILEKGVKSLEGLYDELIILDTGSTDHTKLIAKSLGAQIYDYTWIDDFSDARRTAQSYSHNDYILVWDADWILSKSSHEAFRMLKNQDFQNADHICFNWINEFDYTTLEKYRIELRSFIYNKQISTWKHQIHEDLVAIEPKHEIITYVEKGVDVYHYKDKTRRVRYEQNIALINKILLSKDLSFTDRARQQALLGQSYFYDKNYSLALKAYEKSLNYSAKAPQSQLLAIYVIEKAVLSALGTDDLNKAKQILTTHKAKIFTNPRYLLLMGDIAVIEKQFKPALNYYNKFIKHPKVQELIEVDVKRYKDHPAQMIDLLSSTSSTDLNDLTTH